MIKAYRISLAVLGCLIVAGCASKGPAPKPYDASRTTDGALGCDEISGEVDETNRSMRTTAQALATMERHNEKQVMKGLAIGLLTGPIIAQSLVGPEKDTISKHNEIRRMAARNILLANLAAQKDCNPVQALSGDGALYEQGIYRTEEDRFGNPDDERLNAPKPLMFVVAEARISQVNRSFSASIARLWYTYQYVGLVGGRVRCGTQRVKPICRLCASTSIAA